MDGWCYVESISLDLDVGGPPSVPATAYSVAFLHAFSLHITG